MPTHMVAPGIEIRFHQETEVVHSMHGVRKPDKNWIVFDSHAHAHAWSGDELPTLYEKVAGTTWVGDEFDGQEVDVTEWRCKVCDEVVTPRYVTDYSPVYIEGPPQYTLVIHPSLEHEREYPIPDGDIAPLIEIFGRMFSRD